MVIMNSNIGNNEKITEFRPWGYFTVLEEDNNFKVKKLFVNPGHRLSLQLHNHRDEQWVVVEGEALVTCGNEQKSLSGFQTINIPKNTIHRIENKSNSPVVIIEVQSGEYLGEDDIVRFEDDYSRVKN